MFSAPNVSFLPNILFTAVPSHFDARSEHKEAGRWPVDLAEEINLVRGNRFGGGQIYEDLWCRQIHSLIQMQGGQYSIYLGGPGGGDFRPIGFPKRWSYAPVAPPQRDAALAPPPPDPGPSLQWTDRPHRRGRLRPSSCIERTSPFFCFVSVNIPKKIPSGFHHAGFPLFFLFLGIIWKICHTPWWC